MNKFLFQQASADFGKKSREDLERARKECIAELSVPMPTVAEYHKRIFSPEGVTPCYIRCVFHRLGLFEDKGGFITDNYMLQLGREDVRGSVTGCYDYSGTDTCMWAFRGFTCFNKGGFLPEGY